MEQRQYFTNLEDSPYNILANAIMEKELAGKEDPGTNPVALFTVGAPGAGKTEFLSGLAASSEGSIEKVRFLTAEALAQGEFTLPPRGEVALDHQFDDAVYITTAVYREKLAVHALNEKGVVAGEHYGPDKEKAEEKTALAYAKTQMSKQEYEHLMQVGSEIAKQLLLHCVENGVNCVLDSTGGGFAPMLDQDGNRKPNDPRLTEALMQAAAASGTNLHFIRLDTSEETAKERAQQDFEAGKKPFFNPDAIAQDITRAELAMAEIESQAQQFGISPVIVTLDENLQVDKSRSTQLAQPVEAQAQHQAESPAAHSTRWQDKFHPPAAITNFVDRVKAKVDGFIHQR